GLQCAAINAKCRKDVSNVLDTVKKIFLPDNDRVLKPRTKMIIVGAPNVGKSTLINNFRSMALGIAGKAVPVGKIPGITKTTVSKYALYDPGQMIKVNQHPLVYMLDSPGILVPNITNMNIACKLLIVGCVKEGMIEPVIAAKQFIKLMNEARNEKYFKFIGLNAPVSEDEEHKFLRQICNHHKIFKSGGDYDFQRAFEFVLRRFRDGHFGRISLDEPHDLGCLKKELQMKRFMKSLTRRERKEVKDSRSSNEMEIQERVQNFLGRESINLDD
ncbi:hypothetical protein ROZALSC1DRAFT_27375, partial [Rozella allomycis CSF55]